MRRILEIISRYLDQAELRRLARKGVVRVGAHTYGAPRIRWWGEDAGLAIGKYCSIAPGVTIFLGGNHRTDWVTTFPFPSFAGRGWEEARHVTGHPATKGSVAIGNDVWLGAGSVVLSGVTIADGAVVGANAVVSKDVPPYAIVAGNPARVVKFRFNEPVIARLLAVRWWDWPEDAIKRHMHLLCSGNISEFLAQAEKIGL